MPAAERLVGLALASIGGPAVRPVLPLAEQGSPVLEPRLVVAYGLIALLVAAAGIGLWLMLTVQSRRQRKIARDRRSERAARS